MYAFNVGQVLIHTCTGVISSVPLEGAKDLELNFLINLFLILCIYLTGGGCIIYLAANKRIT